MMSEQFFTEWFFSIIIFFIGTVIYAIVKSYLDNKRWERDMYKRLERYRSKYGFDDECEIIVGD